MKNKHLRIKESCFCGEFSRIHKLSMKIILQTHNNFSKIKQSCWTFAPCCQGQKHVSIRKPFSIAWPHELKLPSDLHQFLCISAWSLNSKEAKR
jgi:hypothetical protein